MKWSWRMVSNYYNWGRSPFTNFTSRSSFKVREPTSLKKVLQRDLFLTPLMICPKWCNTLSFNKWKILLEQFCLGDFSHIRQYLYTHREDVFNPSNRFIFVCFILLIWCNCFVHFLLHILVTFFKAFNGEFFTVFIQKLLYTFDTNLVIPSLHEIKNWRYHMIINGRVYTIEICLIHTILAIFFLGRFHLIGCHSKRRLIYEINAVKNFEMLLWALLRILLCLIILQNTFGTVLLYHFLKI